MLLESVANSIANPATYFHTLSYTPSSASLELPRAERIHATLPRKSTAHPILPIMSSSEHLATDNVGPSPGQGSSATLHAHGDPNSSTTPSSTSTSTSTSASASSGPGHAHQVAQAQGLKLDTAASNQPPAGASSGSSGETRGGGPLEGSFKRPGGFAENPNARSKTITLAEGENTYGVSRLPFG